MKVWLVVRVDWDDQDVISVWDSEDAARLDHDQHKEADTQDMPYGWRVEEHEVLSTGTRSDEA